MASLVGCGFAVWGLSIGLGRLADNSLFTHIATGRLILDSGIPRVDPYSFTAPGVQWVVQSWLAAAFFGLTDKWGGADGIRLLFGVSTALLAWLVWVLTTKAHSLVPRILITGLVVSVGVTVWSPRPLLFGLIFLSLTLLALEGRLPAWTMVPVMWLWLNSHGSFPLGIAAIVCVLIGLRGDKADISIPVRCLKWAAGGVALGVINPLGPVLIWFPIRLLSRQEMLSHVIEWQSPSFSSPWSRIFLLQVMLATVLLVRRPTYRVAVPLVVFTAAALLGSRNVAPAALVLVPGMAIGFENVGALVGNDRGKGVWLGFVGSAVVALLLIRSTLATPAYDLREFPVDAVAFVDGAGWHDAGIDVATQETVGNYMTLIYGADARVFFDDRVDMYPPEVMEDFLTLYGGDRLWRDVLDERDIDVVVWSSDLPLASLIREDPRWRVVYDDARWIVACDREAGSPLNGAGEGRLSCDGSRPGPDDTSR